jgi:hypothetical protein
MRNLSGVSVILGALMATGGVLALTAVGCGGDDNGTPGSDGAAPDQTVSDGQTAVDGHSDAHTDGKVVKETGGDVVTKDTGPMDGGADADAASFDAAALYAFPNAVNTAYCKQLQSCCAKDMDAGPFDIAACASENAAFGGLYNVNLANVHGGHINFDQDAAAKCIADQAALTCGTYTAAEYTAAVNDCSTAMTGKLQIGDGPCLSAWDCAPPAYCAGAGGVAIDSIFANDGGTLSGAFVGGNQSADAGQTGVCTALRSVNQSCNDLFFYTDCTYLGNGSPALFCNQDGGTGPGQCVPALTTGTACVVNVNCTPQVCDSVTGECQATTVFDDTNDCTFAFPDAGDGG